MTDIDAFLARQLARPMTHRVVTTFADGEVRTHETRSLGAAENHATGERRKIGRDLIARDPVTLRFLEKPVRIVSVKVEPIA